MALHKELQFDDLSDFWHYAVKDSDAWNRESRSEYHLDWSGGLTWTEAKVMALSGWREGLEKIDRTDVGRPEDLAEVIAFLASDDAAFVQGAAVIADGGRLGRL